MFLPYRLFLWHSRNLLFPRPSIRAAGLDKTGTLTKGEFAVLHVEEFKTSIAQAGATCHEYPWCKSWRNWSFFIDSARSS